MIRGLADVSDPWPLRALRLVRVARSTDIARHLQTAKLRGTPSIVLRHGLNAAMLHEIHACTHPDRVAVLDEQRSLTYAQMNREINRLGSALRSRLGLAHGDSVVLALENRAEYLVGWFAAMRIGARVLHAGGHATGEELADFARGGRARVVLASAATIEAVRQARATLADPELDVIVCGRGTAAPAELTYDEVLAQGQDAFPAAFGRARGESVVFTSGTTGRPKGAVRDFASFGPRELARVLERLPFAFGDRHLVVGPLHHSAPQVFTLLHTALAGTIELAPRFDAEAALRTLSTHRIHSVFVVPTMLQRMLDLPESVQRQTPTPDLRAIVVGSSEFPEELRRAAIARFGARVVFDFYGATELGWLTLIRGDEMLAHPGSVGRALAGQQIRILGEGGAVLPPRATGIIGVRNAQTMLGYARDPGATSETRRGPWWTVQDMGWLDEDGYLYLSGRAFDMVKTGGVNVYPAEIERVIGQDPAVREISVIGVRDRQWGERLVGVVVPRGESFDSAAVTARARMRLSPAKVPREWHVVEALPRNENGKVLKAELRARFAT
jgi:fatty-acyl-CoA synthase